MIKIKLLFIVVFTSLSIFNYSQPDSTLITPKTRPNIPDSAFEDMGVSVSPSSMHLNIKPGTSVTREIKVKNATRKVQKFNVLFNDFVMNEQGKPIKPEPNKCKYCLSKYIGVSPSYFELKPGEEIKVKLNIAIPDSLLKKTINVFLS
jgi:hypothetical protein